MGAGLHLANGLLDHDATPREGVFVAKALPDAMGAVALFLGSWPVVVQDLPNDGEDRLQDGPTNELASAITGWVFVGEDLFQRRPVNVVNATGFASGDLEGPGRGTDFCPVVPIRVHLRASGDRDDGNRPIIAIDRFARLRAALFLRRCPLLARHVSSAVSRCRRQTKLRREHQVGCEGRISGMQVAIATHLDRHGGRVVLPDFSLPAAEKRERLAHAVPHRFGAFRGQRDRDGSVRVAPGSHPHGHEFSSVGEVDRDVTEIGFAARTRRMIAWQEGFPWFASPTLQVAASRCDVAWAEPVHRRRGSDRREPETVRRRGPRVGASETAEVPARRVLSEWFVSVSEFVGNWTDGESVPSALSDSRNVVHREHPAPLAAASSLHAKNGRRSFLSRYRSCFPSHTRLPSFQGSHEMVVEWDAREVVIPQLGGGDATRNGSEFGERRLVPVQRTFGGLPRADEYAVMGVK